jgi:hypothetical protein
MRLQITSTFQKAARYFKDCRKAVNATPIKYASVATAMSLLGSAVYCYNTFSGALIFPNLLALGITAPDIFDSLSEIRRQKSGANEYRIG